VYKGRTALALVVFFAVLCAGTPGAPPPATAGETGQNASDKKPDTSSARPAPTDVNQLSLEVSALQRLDHFEFTRSQLETLAAMATETMQKPRIRQAAKVSAKYHQAMLDLREALLIGNSDRIDDLSDKLEDLYESDKPTLDDAVDVTEAARHKTDGVFKLLNVRQIAAYVANNADRFTDPLEVMMEALDKGRSTKGKEWKEHREETIQEVSELLGGINVAEVRKLHGRIAAWLDRGYKLTPDTFKSQRADLEKDAQKIVGDAGPMKIMRHVIDRDLAELLANPQLAAAVELRLKTLKP
jgi:hypothetical protein